jgi:uncharacterized membrane protein YiaA
MQLITFFHAILICEEYKQPAVPTTLNSKGYIFFREVLCYFTGVQVTQKLKRDYFVSHPISSQFLSYVLHSLSFLSQMSLMLKLFNEVHLCLSGAIVPNNKEAPV